MILNPIVVRAPDVPAGSAADVTAQPDAARSAGPADFAALERYFRQQPVPTPTHLGQLADAFQNRLQDYHRNITSADCDFYHTVEFGEGKVYEGAWDLRGSEAAYLGHYDFHGKRVLEVGPASGWLSAYMASQGADLVVLDLPIGACPELVPHPDIDLVAAQMSGSRSASRLRNSWWFTKFAIGYEARAVYADIYQLPTDLGRFDVAVFGSVLLHLSNPFRALQSVASIVDEAIIITDVFSAPSIPALDSMLNQNLPLVLFNPTPPPVGLVHWWSLSPDVPQQMLKLLGFTQLSAGTHTPSAMKSQPPMFTVVGRRPSGAHLVAHPSEAQKLATGTSAAMSDAAAGIGTDGLPLPPASSRFLVAGTDDPLIFLNLGRQGFDALTQSLQRAGVEVGRLERVLDFGCGVGRVLRYWQHSSGVEVNGTDFEPSAIAWDRDNLPFAQFKTNQIDGPLDYPDGHFDLVYCLSVFTHLPTKMQLPWFHELTRILRPGGMLYFTVHGSHYLHMLNAEQQAAFARGELVEAGIERPGTNFCAIFHPIEYVRRELAEPAGLSVVEFLPRGARGNPDQDSYLVRKPTEPVEDLRSEQASRPSSAPRRGARTMNGTPRTR